MKKKWLYFSLIFLLLGILGYFLFQKVYLPNEVEEQERPKVQIVDEASSSRPYGIMINNLSVARPYHSGLQDAYLVYEMIVEGGITRYFALFSNQMTSRIGPVRSARPYYLDYAMENDAYYVHWGFSEQAKSDLSKFAIQNINGLYQDSYFWRDQTLPVATEHRAFTSMDKLKNAVQDFEYREKREGDYLFQYSARELDFTSVENKKIANRVFIPYSAGSITSYQYDTEKKVYLQSVNDVAHTDYVTKEQYTVKNILVYQVKNVSIDSYGRQSLENIGNGKGYYITNGYAIPIMWEKKSRKAKTKYTYLDGTEVQLNDGNTWIHIAPISQELSILE